MDTKFEIVCSTYEEYLLGYSYDIESAQIEQTFATHDHTSSIRCVTIKSNYLASGGADDRIFVYDLRSRRELCSLTHHKSTITCLQFSPNASHLLSGSADGVFAIVRVGNWQLEKIWTKLHKGSAIQSIAIHNTGKLALTLGADGTLITWNLVKGRQAYVTNLRNRCKNVQSLVGVQWAPDNTHFILFGGCYTEIWSIESGSVVHVIEHFAKINDCLWLDEDILVTAHEDGALSTYAISDAYKSTTIQAHHSRAKALAKYNEYLVSICSTGEIKIWNSNLDELAKCEAGCRLTCVTIAQQSNKSTSSVSSSDDDKVLYKLSKKSIKKAVMTDQSKPRKRKINSNSKKSVKKTLNTS